MDLSPLIQEYFSKFDLLFLCVSGVQSLFSRANQNQLDEDAFTVKHLLKCKLNINSVSDQSLLDESMLIYHGKLS